MAFEFVLFFAAMIYMSNRHSAAMFALSQSVLSISANGSQSQASNLVENISSTGSIDAKPSAASSSPRPVKERRKSDYLSLLKSQPMGCLSRSATDATLVKSGEYIVAT